MKFNAKYNRYVSKDGSIYRLKNGVLHLCKDTYNNGGYVQCSVTSTPAYALVHRIVYETFNGEIPEGYEIDHVNSVRDDNRLCNLQMLTRSENLKKRKRARQIQRYCENSTIRVWTSVHRTLSYYRIRKFQTIST